MLAPMAGAADSSTGGSTIAEPLSPTGAMFGNPAGLAGFTDRSFGQGIGFAYGVGEVTATEPAGYQARNEVLVVFPEFDLVVPHGRWTFGVSSIGTSGNRFDYGPRPALGVDDGFFSESAVFGLPLAAAYRVSDELWLGVELIPLFGQNHLRFSREVAEFPGTATPFRFTVYGFGLQAMAGLTWKPTERWSFGFSFRPPGRIWAQGDMKLGSGKQDVDLELEAPAEFSLGVSRRLGQRWKLSYALRFIDASVLSSSYFRFEDTPSANMPFLSDARDEWRNALGFEYAWTESLTVLGGFAAAGSIVGNKGVSPAAYDSEDFRLSTGLTWRGVRWKVTSGFAYIFGGVRNIPEADALVLPGKYDSKPAYILGFSVARKF